MRYRLHRDLVLRGIDLKIPSRSKLAFCGRTGCGKSSLFSVLNRLYPLASGRVLIDGIDISTLPLRTLRAKVRVVSQESFLISGSLRQNLTMGTEGSEGRSEGREGNGAASGVRGGVSGVGPGVSAVSDEVLWYCLRVVGLEEKVRNLPETLDFTVDVAGQNFSVGERQLITLARVLVPSRPCSLADWAPPRILLCDEATANIDVLTDEKVHDVVLSLEATVMMICHRLQHIKRFQQVVVLDAGKLVEQGSPSQPHIWDDSVQPQGCDGEISTTHGDAWRLRRDVQRRRAVLHTSQAGAKANMHARLPGCISPTLLSPMSRHSPISPKSPISPVSPGKRIRRNAAILGIPLDLRRGQASLPLPVRSLLGDIIFPTDFQGISYVGDGMEQPTYTVSTVRRGATVNTLAATAPFRKVVRGGA
eukprot:s151_g28.t1